MTPEDLVQARELVRLANKVLEAVDAGDEVLTMDYLVDLNLAVTKVDESFCQRYEEHFETTLRRRGLIPQKPPELMTREEDQLQRESDERAAFNDRLDNLRNER